MTFWNEDTFTWTLSVQGLPVILKWNHLQSLDKALDLFIEIKFCESDFCLLNGSKNCMVATYNFGSVYIWMGPFIFLSFYSVLAQVKDFLPRLAEANQILKEKVENGEGDAIDIETIEDNVESVIQMVSCDVV